MWISLGGRSVHTWWGSIHPVVLCSYRSLAVSGSVSGSAENGVLTEVCWVFLAFWFSEDLVVGFRIASPGREKGNLQRLAYLWHLPKEQRPSKLQACALSQAHVAPIDIKGQARSFMGPGMWSLFLARGVVMVGITGFTVPRNHVLGLLSFNGGNS